ncbi:MAG: efflux RND transporter periplasmic adaptor subunit, partial [Planctomycetes bacterium]|nr:efflux RND transporter periplasmic adaptor subunit [Planctomycetota bacterium]
VSRVERRSSAVRQLEQLAELVRRAQEPTWYSDGVCDTLPPIAEAVERHAEQSHARQAAAIPLDWLADRSSNPSDDPARNRPSHAGDGARFVLVAEQFDAGNDFTRERLVEVGQVCSTALYNALEVDQLPLGWLVRPLSTAKQAVVKHLTQTATIAAFATVAVAALALVPADFHVEAPGTLQPVVRRNVFAPRSGLVDEVLVQHGDHVASGQALVRLRDPQLELERKRVDGELETASRQLDAVRATKTQRAIRDGSAVDTYRLSAEQRELEQQLANLRQERALLDQEREKQVVTSPIAGQVLTWDVANRLITRPVERGEVLVTVADLLADWQLEIDVADDRIGHVIAARDAIRSDLPVDFRLISDDRELHHGHIHEVCLTADVEAKQETAPSPTVLVKVAFDAEALGVPIRGELRPGVSARARIACGRRSLGYVWFHDLWDAVVGWLRF